MKIKKSTSGDRRCFSVSICSSVSGGLSNITSWNWRQRKPANGPEQNWTVKKHFTSTGERENERQTWVKRERERDSCERERHVKQVNALAWGESPWLVFVLEIVEIILQHSKAPFTHTNNSCFIFTSVVYILNKCDIFTSWLVILIFMYFYANLQTCILIKKI